MKTLQDFKNWCRQKKVAVLGAGISNRPLINLLLSAGAETWIFDRRAAGEFEEFKLELKGQGLEAQWSLGENYLDVLQGFDLIFRTPIIRPDLPALVAERRRGAIISSEMELFFHLCPAEIIGVSGSDGKTTTSTLCALALEEGGYTTHLGGNIGKPLLADLEEIKPQDKVVVELSSFQLISMRQSPHTAVLSNITPNHLDVHKDFAEYVKAKTEIFRHQHLTDRLVLNAFDPFLQSFAAEAKGELIWTGKRPFGDQKLFAEEDGLLYYQARPAAPKEVLLRAEEISMPGYFNRLNILSALAATSHLLDAHTVAPVLAQFKGVEHRQEFIREFHGKRYYNSSIDSSPARSLATISAFHSETLPLYLIAGGKDKNLDYSELGRALSQQVKKLYLCGENQKKIRDAVEEYERGAGVSEKTPIYETASYEDALKLIQMEDEPAVVLFSPAGTSFDRFANFAERGRIFKELVHALK